MFALQRKYVFAADHFMKVSSRLYLSPLVLVEGQFSPVWEGWKKVHREHWLRGFKLGLCQRGIQPAMTFDTNVFWFKRERNFWISEEEAEWLHNYQMNDIFQNALVLFKVVSVPPIIYSDTMYLQKIMRALNWNKCLYCGLTHAGWIKGIGIYGWHTVLTWSHYTSILQISWITIIKIIMGTLYGWFKDGVWVSLWKFLDCVDLKVTCSWLDRQSS